MMRLLGETVRPPVKRRATWTGLLVALSLAAALTTQTHLDAGVLDGVTVEGTTTLPVEGDGIVTAEVDVATPASEAAPEPSAAVRSDVQDLIEMSRTWRDEPGPMGVPAWVWRGEAAPTSETAAGAETVLGTETQGAQTPAAQAPAVQAAPAQAQVPSAQVAVPRPVESRPNLVVTSARDLTPRRSAPAAEEQRITAGGRELYVVPLTPTRGQVTKSGTLELSAAPKVTVPEAAPVPAPEPQPVMRAPEPVAPAAARAMPAPVVSAPSTTPGRPAPAVPVPVITVSAAAVKSVPAVKAPAAKTTVTVKDSAHPPP